MPSSSPPEAERARPLLGTIVSVRVSLQDPDERAAAIEAAFAEIALVHRLMSFHEAGSELSRLHRDAVHEPVQVDTRTFEVLRWSLRLAELSDGVFDVVRAAAAAVQHGALPAPPEPADPAASWTDVELIPELSAVAFRRPLLIDLGGVAKGYAVDRAVAAIGQRGASRAVVNAGGDLRVMGTELVALRAPAAPDGSVPMVELSDASLASSGGDPDAPGRHFDGRSGAQIRADRFVSVMAQGCMLADSLTKVVLAQGEACQPLLAQLGATAWLLEPGAEWLTLGEAS